MKTILEISNEGCPGMTENWYEVYDDQHANPQNPSGWVADMSKVEMENYREECGEHTFVPYAEGETEDEQ